MFNPINETEFNKEFEAIKAKAEARREEFAKTEIKSEPTGQAEWSPEAQAGFAEFVEFCNQQHNNQVHQDMQLQAILHHHHDM